MRLSSSLTAPGFALLATAATAQQVALPIPELHTTAQLTFELTPGTQNAFRAVTIDCNGHRERFLRKPDNDIAPIPRTRQDQEASAVQGSVSGLKINASRLFFTATGPRTLLFFLSHAWASDPAALYVLGFHPDGAPYRVLVRDYFEPVLVETGSGADTRITGKASYSEVIAGESSADRRKPYAISYDPFSVFVVHGDEPAVYSAGLSESYNRQHYVWAGPKAREDYGVIYNLPGHPKPFGAPAEQATALVDAALKVGQKQP